MIFVTGATGILGRRIVLDLLLNGNKVLASKRESSNLNDMFNTFKDENQGRLFSLIQWVDVDFSDIESINNVLKGVTQIYHCLGKVSFAAKDHKEIMEVNVSYLKNLLCAVQSFPIEKFCYFSTISILNTLNSEGKIDENSTWDNQHKHNSYSTSKYIAEMEVWRAAAEGLNVVIVNMGVLLASGRWKNSSNVTYQWFEKSRFLINGKTSFVDVRDVSNIVMKLMQKEKYNQRYLLFSGEYYYKDISNNLKKKIGKKPVLILPISFVPFIVFFSRLFFWRLEVLNIVNKKSIDQLLYNPPCSNAKIVQELNYNFLPIEESVDYHCNNYLKHRNYNM